MSIAVIGYWASAAFFLLLALVLLTGKRGRAQKNMLMAAAIVSTLWSGSMAYSAAHQYSFLIPHVLELVRNLAWIGFVLRVLASAYSGNSLATRRFRQAFVVFSIFTLIMIILVNSRYTSLPRIASISGIDLLLGGQLLMATAGLVMVEQLFRNTRKEALRAIKYVCMALGILFAYDFYMYADALLFQRVDSAPWQARGFVNALIVPVLGIAVFRDPKWSLDISVSRHIVFHTATLLGAAIYMLAIGAGGYYVRVYGGEWGAVAQITFLFGAGLVLLIFFFSGQLRANLRVLINKHFFHYKYDYRDEWLRFTKTLSLGQSVGEVRQHVIRAMAEIIEAPAGMLWMRKDHGGYEAIARWGMEEKVPQTEPAGSSLVEFLQDKKWVINLDEYDRSPQLYTDLAMPNWLHAMARAWLVTPLILGEQLLGFVVLVRSPASYHFNWEDYDLLKTAGRQAATHMAQVEADEALAAARQFEVFNRLSAFVVHDIKNLIAQLSLVVSNAAKHRNNPDFMEDAIGTVGNSVTKMSRLLQELRSGGVREKPLEYLDLCEVLAEVVQNMSAGKPVPKLDCQARGIGVRTDRDRFAAVIGHLVQNAQDATPDDGTIIVRLFKSMDHAVVEVQDNGAGMEKEFINERLFRPFDTTKGEAGMGIGVYEAGEFVREMGGDIGVITRLGEGSTFRIKLPIGNKPDAVQSREIKDTGMVDGNRFKEITDS